MVSGEVLLLNGRWYVTSAGLLRLAQEYHCRGIHTHAVVRLCDAQNDRWVFKATVYKSPALRSSSVMATPIPRTLLLSSAARRCAWLKRERSTVLCAKRMESGSARLRSWDHSRGHPNPSRLRPTQMDITVRMGRITVSRDCVINSAFSSANPTSIVRS